MSEDSLKSLCQYCHGQEYKGWDLFDGLNSRLFKAIPLYRIRLLRLAWIQFFKRCPVNLRGPALVQGKSPEEIAACLERIIADRDNMANIGRYNAAYAKERFMASRLLNIYNSTLGGC